ncbi:MAG: hypothetical protein K0S38_475 [Candidatus Paceibacter sp.]|jgi:hypothetical protein|nr:hypothetical protein [Candidatus Paceibacter sp.]
MIKKEQQKIGLIILGALVGIFIFSYGIIPFFTKDVYDPLSAEATAGNDTILGTTTPPVPEPPKIVHVKTPAVVKGIYMSACVVGTKDFRESLVHIADTTEINSIMIDVKDFSGMLSFKPEDPSLHEYVSPKCGARDMMDFLKYLHSKDIYVIARVTVFQDPFYPTLHPEAAIKKKSDGGIWKDKKGLSFLDPSSRQAWDHTVAIAKASYDIGFDEVNFDYIRYPSDGNVSDISLPAGTSKPEALETFWKYLDEKMKEHSIPTSADLFGMTTTNFDDLGIGQVLERALPHFDYVMPMVYPSHYPPGFNGWKNPNTVVYDLIHYVMKRGVERTVATSSPINTLASEYIASTSPSMYTKESYEPSKLRTWIQDFDYGGDYGPVEVRAQIQASNDVGVDSWIIWSPSNKYTVAALKSE